MSRLIRIYNPQCTPERMLVLCWLTYMLAYLLRTNMSAVIPAMMTARRLSYAQMGVITSLFFFAYMFGQLLSGWLGNRYDGKLQIIGGLAVSSLCNVGMILASNAVSLSLIWAINGLAQSFLWAPLMKILSSWFSACQLERVSFIMSLSLIVGNAVSWSFSTAIATLQVWTAAFWVPALLVGFFLLFLIPTFRSTGKQVYDVYLKIPGQLPNNQCAEEAFQPNRLAKADNPNILVIARLIGLPGLMLIAIAQGVIREGINIWLPSIIGSTTSLSYRSPWLILAIAPIFNLGGIIFVRKINHYYKGNTISTLLLTIILVTTAAIILNLLLPQWRSMILAVTLLILCLTNGLTPILTSVIPFKYIHLNCVSLLVGMLDFAIYVGAAVSAFFSGLIADKYSLNGLMLLWLASSIMGLIFIILRKFKFGGLI